MNDFIREKLEEIGRHLDFIEENTSSLERPSIQFRPTLRVLDDNRYQAVYGEGKAGGGFAVVATGRTPEEAMRNFDAEWINLS